MALLYRTIRLLLLMESFHYMMYSVLWFSARKFMVNIVISMCACNKNDNLCVLGPTKLLTKHLNWRWFKRQWCSYNGALCWQVTNFFFVQTIYKYGVSISQIMQILPLSSVRPSTKRTSLQWRHNEQDRVSNHQPHDCSLNYLFRRRSKKTSKLRITGLCAVTGEFPAQMANNEENVFIWWHHHDAVSIGLHTVLIIQVQSEI